ncbi:DUF5819 family protein [Streptomyces sp. NPDC005955]|uniref:DUF5819 family protein n=1 Tax=Streptomyces sp. NPDC005955 TaxID=3364738 RepID=UPI0036A2ED7B
MDEPAAGPSPASASSVRGQAAGEPVSGPSVGDGAGGKPSAAGGTSGWPLVRGLPAAGTSAAGPQPGPVRAEGASATGGADTGEPTGGGPPAGNPPATSRAGIAGLPLGQQLTAALALALAALAVAAHLGLSFLHVAPSNTMSKQYADAIDAWIYPEFEQNWKLFAPNPLQQNVAVHARAQVRGEDGQRRTTDWIDLSALDGEAIEGNLLPSHTEQNELRRAWDFFVGSHDAQNQPNGLRGTLSGEYVRRIVVMRLERLQDEERDGRGGTVERIQVRAATTNVAPPSWSGETVDLNPSYRQLPWWSVTEDDRPLDAAGDTRARSDRTEETP